MAGTRTLLVYGAKTFKITVPEDAKLTFGPFSPPQSRGANKLSEPWTTSDRAGTLRVYDKATGNPLGVFSGVNGFRDLSIGYAELIAKEEGASLWKDDDKGYTREHKQSQTREWVEDPSRLLHEGKLAHQGKARGKK